MHKLFKVYKFNGDVKILKSLGYTFKKLFAKNHKVYMLNRLSMYVKGGMVLELDNINHVDWYTIIKFILDNKDQDTSMWSRRGGNNRMGFFNTSNYRIVDGVIYSYEEFRIKATEDQAFCLLGGQAIEHDLALQILTLDKVCPLLQDTI